MVVLNCVLVLFFCFCFCSRPQKGLHAWMDGWMNGEEKNEWEVAMDAYNCVMENANRRGMTVVVPRIRNGCTSEYPRFIHSRAEVEGDVSVHISDGVRQKIALAWPHMLLEEGASRERWDLAQTALPSCVLAGRLYLGDMADAVSPNLVNLLHVSHQVNVACELDHLRHASPTISFHHIPMVDDADEDMAQQMQQAIDLVVRLLLEENGIILVHCAAGRSRSAAVVIGVLMRIHKMSLDEAMAKVKHCRSIIHPNHGLQAILRSFFAA